VTGPLHGIRVIELASLAPGPFGCMMLADLGADVILVDRPGGSALPGIPPRSIQRGRRTVTLDLKTDAGMTDMLQLIGHADVLVEGFRPGVAERLGFGPEDCEKINPRLVYARMTGWGQDGPLAARAGHDIDYIALAGALEPLGRPGERPQPPMNLVGDFGGGGMLLAVGVLAALLERERSGRGQVVDAAMLDGSALLTSFVRGMIDAGAWSRSRGENLLDGGAPFYDTYTTADGGFMAVGALEPAFYRELLDGLGLDELALPGQYDRDGWPELRRVFTERFASRSRAEWTAVFDGTDACVVPVLSPAEAPGHPHNVARGTFEGADGVVQPAPAPRFGRTQASMPDPPRTASVAEVLSGWSSS
jgi:alpha-methylacyl-CoA racemase